MERPEFVSIVSPLVVAMRSQFDQPTWTVYFRALEDVPPLLLQAAVDRALKSGSAFMPKPGELRAFAEDARNALVATVKYDPSLCAQCEGSGWEPLTEDGITRVRRCWCWRRHLERIRELGVGTEPLALPAGDDGRHEPAEACRDDVSDLSGATLGR